MLLIKTDPHAASLCVPYLGPNTVGRAPFTEMKPPIDALLNTREARGRLAERSIVRLVEGQDIIPVRQRRPRSSASSSSRVKIDSGTASSRSRGMGLALKSDNP